MNVETILNGSKDIARLEREILLSFVLNTTREWLVTHSTKEIESNAMQKYNQLLNRRRTGEPVAYITGTKEFYGRAFFVSPDVLIPRPATESIIHAVFSAFNNEDNGEVEADTEVTIYTKIFGELSDVQTIVDIGTGSGCIAITLALELPRLNIIASDISDQALVIAKKNAKQHNVLKKIEWKKGSLLKPLEDVVVPFIVVSNPPYIPLKEKLMVDVEEFEPRIALRGGKNGNELVIELLKQAKQHPCCRGIIIECKKGQIQ